MKVDDGESMWCLVMFDLPVKTKPQRRNAAAFRKLLLDMGYCRIQYSVYARYTPTAGGSRVSIKRVKASLPAGGDVRVVQVTDRQWSSAFRFSNAEERKPEATPEQLTIF